MHIARSVGSIPQNIGGKSGRGAGRSAPGLRPSLARPTIAFFQPEVGRRRVGETLNRLKGNAVGSDPSQICMYGPSLGSDPEAQTHPLAQTHPKLPLLPFPLHANLCVLHVCIPHQNGTTVFWPLDRPCRLPNKHQGEAGRRVLSRLSSSLHP